MNFNKGDRVIMLNQDAVDMDPPDQGVIKVIDPQPGRQIPIYGTWIDGKIIPTSGSEMAINLVWLPKDKLLHE